MAYVVPEELKSLRQSDIGTMLSCGRKLYLSKVENYPRPSTKKQIVGTSFHRGVENIYRSIMLGDRVDLLEAKAEAVEKIKVGFALADPTTLGLEPGETVDTATATSGGLVLRALDHYFTEILPGIIGAGEPMGVEERIEFSYRGYEMNGTVDLIDGAACLRDHKFSGMYLPKSGWPDSYLSQMSRYSWFLLMIEKPVLDIRLDMLSYARANNKKDPRFDYKGYTMADSGFDMATLVRLGKESVDAALDMIEAGVFPRSGANAFGLGCGLCPFAGSICAGTTVPVAAPSAAA